MKIKYFLVSVALSVILPQLLFGVFGREKQENLEPTVINQQQYPSETQEILVLNGDIVERLDFEAYIVSVVLGEMPADFEMEALKAQAVAARTYTLRNVKKGWKHLNAHICTNASCCQAFVDLSDQSLAQAHIERVKRAVTETAGQVITYKGDLIDATYFSCSGGKTEDALAVWGRDVPYLVSVDSPGEEECRYFEISLTFSMDMFSQKLRLDEACTFTNRDIAVTYTAGGGVETMSIGNATYSGVEVRNLLGLASTSFSIDINKDEVFITTKGNGHRVGMSQYGAEAMAVEGYTYDEILSHYYVNTDLKTITQVQMKAMFDKEEIL